MWTTALGRLHLARSRSHTALGRWGTSCIAHIIGMQQERYIGACSLACMCRNSQHSPGAGHPGACLAVASSPEHRARRAARALASSTRPHARPRPRPALASPGPTLSARAAAAGGGHGGVGHAVRGHQPGHHGAEPGLWTGLPRVHRLPGRVVRRPLRAPPLAALVLTPPGNASAVLEARDKFLCCLNLCCLKIGYDWSKGSTVR